MVSAKPILVSAASGCVWAAIAVALLERGIAWPIWSGILASPIIGALAGMVSIEFQRRRLVTQLVLALVSLYAATALFGGAIGVADVVFGVNGGPGWRRVPGAVVVQSVLAMVWGLTLGGYVVFLWPLAWANHMLVATFWQRQAERSVAVRSER
jgi:hypothetical protein